MGLMLLLTRRVDEHCQHVRVAQKRSTRQTGTGLQLKYSISPMSMSRNSSLLSPTHQDSSNVLKLIMLQRKLPHAAHQHIVLNCPLTFPFPSCHSTQPLFVHPSRLCPTWLHHPCPPNPPLLCLPASSVCSLPPPIEYHRSPSSKTLPDQHVIMTSQRSCPSCPCPSTPYLLPCCPIHDTDPSQDKV